MQRPDIKKLNMKLILKIGLVLFVVLTVLFVGAVIFIQSKGKQIASERLSVLLERRVTIGNIQVLYPLGLRLTNLGIEGYGFVKEVTVGLGVFHLLDNDLNFSAIILNEPRTDIHKTKDGAIVFGNLPVEKSIPVPGSAEEVAAAGSDTNQGQKKEASPIAKKNQNGKKALRFSVDKLIIKNGAVNFYDHSSDAVGEMTLRDVDLKVRHLSMLERPMRTKFDFTAVMANSQKAHSGGKISSHGWFNLARKDMKGELTVEDLDGTILSPIYGESFKKNVQNLVADLVVDLESKDNDMTVKGKLQIKDIAFAPKEPEDSKSFSPEDFLLGSLQSLAKGLAIEFRFKTKMDQFKIESISFTGNIFSGLFPSDRKFEIARK